MLVRLLQRGMLVTDYHYNQAETQSKQLMDQIKQYETIADAFAASMALPFREAIEQHTLRELLGDVSRANVVDMACGDGFYTRWVKRSGALTAMGLDVSVEMIRRAEEMEQRNPLGCEYRQSDIATAVVSNPVDVVIAVYSLGYARSGAQLRQFCKACYHALREGGRFVGLNDNVRNPPPTGISWRKYGLERYCPNPLSEGDPVRYTIINADGQRFDVENFYLKGKTYEDAFEAVGFSEFRWIDVSLDPAEHRNPFWDDFLTHPPIVGFTASR